MEEKQLTSKELEEQANALLAEADFEEINLPKKAKKAAAAKKANEDTFNRLAKSACVQPRLSLSFFSFSPK